MFVQQSAQSKRRIIFKSPCCFVAFDEQVFKEKSR